MKTSELIGPGLNWAVFKAMNAEGFFWAAIKANYAKWKTEASTNWNVGGPVIERERISISDPAGDVLNSGQWMAKKRFTAFAAYGPTPLIAAMRCFVASKLGDEIEIPKELK